jgi:hypothetical protein
MKGAIEMKLRKRIKNLQVSGTFRGSCDDACRAERQLDALKAGWAANWGLGRIGR